jgi:intracellular septation protein A
MIIFTMLLSVAALIDYAAGRLALISVIFLALLWVITRDLER